MRPVRLEMAGFGAFRDDTEIDFTDTEFFALVGPTGSGKSTVIDAFCFALYGSIPRYDDERLVAPVVSLGALEAKVSFTFDLSGSRYVATRVARLDGKGELRPTKVRLEREESDGSASVLAGKANEMKAAVLSTLGLDFDDFTKCVVLPQGEFAQFLRAKGDDRRRLLTRLLKLDVYERVGRRARAEASEKRAQADARVVRLESLAGATREAKAAAEGRALQLAGLEERLERARPAEEELSATVRSAREAAARATAFVTALEKVAVPEAVRALAAQLDVAEQSRKQARAALEAAALARSEADRAVSELPAVAPLAAAREAHAQLGSCRAALEEALAQVQSATASENQAAAAFNAARRMEEEARSALDHARTSNAAAAIAATLQSGDECPVCLRTIDALPEHESRDLAAAEAALADAAKAARGADREHRARQNEVTAAQTRVQQLAAQEADVIAKVAAHPDAVALESLITSVEQASAVLSAARAAEDEARRAVDEAESALRALHQRANKAQDALHAQRDPLVELGPPALDGGELLRSWTALAEWADGEKMRQRGAVAEQQARASSAEGERRELVASLRTAFVAIAASAGSPDPPSDLVGLLTATARARSGAEQDVVRIDKELAEAEQLRVEVAALAEAAAVAENLGQLLKTNNFIDWLIAEALQVIVTDASRTLGELSAGQFSLAVGPTGEFFVVDHRNADERRSVRTLSGGETFQASLALALALSDQVRHLAAEGAPRLDSIFLDEGFGTLDPDSLEVVASTIENLGRDGRVVGIITHVRELATRVPVRFEVVKGPRSSSVERREA